MAFLDYSGLSRFWTNVKDYIDNNAGSGGSISSRVFAGTCATSSSTQIKVAVVSNFDELKTGDIFCIFFTNYNSHTSPKLKIDGTDYVANIYLSGSTASSYDWKNQEAVIFMYNGTYFYIVGKTHGTNSYYGTVRLNDNASSTYDSSQGYAATPYAVNNVQTIAQNRIISLTSAIIVPPYGASTTKNISGMTSDYEVVKWNFSEHSENDPPYSLQITTSSESITITNNSTGTGTITETIKPVFMVPTNKSAT